MSATSFQISDRTNETPSSNASSGSLPLQSAACDEATGATCHAKHLHNEVQPHLDVIHRELEELKRRRERLEAQRKELLQGKRGSAEGQRSGWISGSVSTHAGAARTNSTPGLTGTHPRSEMESLVACPASHGSRERHSKSSHHDSLLLAGLRPIPSEQERRRRLKATPHLAIKNALRDAAQQDSTLLMGTFLLEDNPHTCTFSRERRFRPLLGQSGKYFLSTDFSVDQCFNRSHAHAATSLKAWGSSSQTPGPGAYTPRYSKLSRAPRAY
ncbi:hypothetical protein Q4I28_003300 [Leishmania naiffi]|uniref:Uncharacterized protein n=1 Tax=Leishmania naiffi TaxID=5678 RepID=A0AAW3BTC1_9TRYP